MEYRQFKLVPKQKAPEGSTGKALKSGWIVWTGEDGTFPDEIESKIMSEEEIFKFNNPTPTTDESLSAMASILEKILEEMKNGK